MNYMVNSYLKTTVVSKDLDHQGNKITIKTQIVFVEHFCRVISSLYTFLKCPVSEEKEKEIPFHLNNC